MHDCPSNPVVLTVYAVSGLFKKKITNKFGKDIKILSVMDLRASGIFSFLKQLFMVKGDPLILPIEDDASAAITPIMKILAFFTRSKSMCLVNRDLEQIFFLLDLKKLKQVTSLTKHINFSSFYKTKFLYLNKFLSKLF